MSKRAHYKNRGMPNKNRDFIVNKNRDFIVNKNFNNPPIHIQHYGFTTSNILLGPGNYWDPSYVNHTFCTNFYGRKDPMNVSVIYEDGSENEIDLNFCCANCSQKSYGWSVDQFSTFFELAKNQILVPATVITSNDLASFLMSNKREV